MEQSTTPRKKVIFSGIQPTGVFTLGNYLGAVKNWGPMQDEYDCTYSVVDLHAITVKQDPAKLRRQTLDCYALLIACGIDPQKSLLFIQSHNPAHSQLAWVLSCFTQFGALGRMTQFKEKSQKHPDDINAGLFTYPVLMAADILAYGTDLVPVGQDQKQHLELARGIANRFNGRFGETFVVPEPYIPETAAKITSLTEPEKKMSKSDPNPNGFISILDEPDVILRKFKKAVTDSEGVVCRREGKAGINNLMSIYSAITGKDFDEIEREFAGKGYGEFKLAVGETVSDELAPIREAFARLSKDREYLEKCYTEGAEKACRATAKMLRKVYKKVGFIGL